LSDVVEISHMKYIDKFGMKGGNIVSVDSLSIFVINIQIVSCNIFRVLQLTKKLFYRGECIK